MLRDADIVGVIPNLGLVLFYGLVQRSFIRCLILISTIMIIKNNGRRQDETKSLQTTQRA